MKKIPTLFKREFENHKVVGVLPEFTDMKCMAAFYFGKPTVKYDGSCCAIIDGVFYKRYDAKKGKPIPEDAIKCRELPDPITGHMPCWVPVHDNDPADKWFNAAFDKATEESEESLGDGTYEAIGPHFQGNPYGLSKDTLIRHGIVRMGDFTPVMYGDALMNKDRMQEALDYTKEYIEHLAAEGLVFWLDGEPVCKIKRSDFGFDWPIYSGRRNKKND